VISGEIFGVTVDADSPEFAKWFGVRVSGDNPADLFHRRFVLDRGWRLSGHPDPPPRTGADCRPHAIRTSSIPTPSIDASSRSPRLTAATPSGRTREDQIAWRQLDQSGEIRDGFCD
jgi:hypothetical protein